MGVRKTTDFIEKLTWGLALFLVVLSIATAYVVPTAQTSSSAIMDEALKESTTNPLNTPAGFATPKATETPAQAPAQQAPAQTPVQQSAPAK